MKTMITTTQGTFEVSSDGRTVWVNREMCVARLCPVSIEYFEVPDGSPYMVRSPGEKDWHQFQADIERMFGVQVGDEHRPKWLAPALDWIVEVKEDLHRKLPVPSNWIEDLVARFPGVRVVPLGPAEVQPLLKFDPFDKKIPKSVEILAKEDAVRRLRKHLGNRFTVTRCPE